MHRQEKRTIAIDCVKKIGEQVRLSGWVYTSRIHGKIAFLDLIDGSGLVQVVATSKKRVNEIASLHPQDVIKVSGIVRKRDPKYENPSLPTGGIEVEVKKIELLSKAETLPFDMGGKELNLQLPTLLDYRSLTLRHPKIKAIFRVQEVVIDAFREAMKKKDFTEFQAPVVIPQAAEGGADVFEVKYFNHKAFLAQSPQFYKQILVGVYERVFTVNKTLRAEPSITTRHLAEVTTLDAEFGFIDGWTDVIDMVEYTIKYILERVNKQCTDILKMYNATVPKIVDTVPRLKLREAQGIIFKRTGRDNRKEPDLEPEDEREICKWALEEKNSDFVFITHYPVNKRPFYTYEDPNDPGYTLSFDLIGRGVELLTGGQRIHELEKLIENAKERGIDLEKSELYLQAFKYGMPPEGGFSFGSERIVMKILDLANVREASLFPRDMERVDVRLP